MKHPQPILICTLTLTDTKTGKVLKRRRFKSRSYLTAIAKLLYVQMSGTGHDIVDTVGTPRLIVPLAGNFATIAAVGVITASIVVGTGTTAVTISDFRLETQITHGTGAGQLSHSTVAITPPSTNATTTSFTITRTFSNNSPGAITVNECGLYGNIGAYKACFIRDVIPGSIEVPATQTLTVTYTIGVTV